MFPDTDVEFSGHRCPACSRHGPLDVFETPLDKANHVNWHNTMKDKLNKISMDLKKKVDKSNDPLKKTMKDKNKTKITQTLAQG